MESITNSFSPVKCRMNTGTTNLPLKSYTQYNQKNCNRKAHIKLPRLNELRILFIFYILPCVVFWEPKTLRPKPFLNAFIQRRHDIIVTQWLLPTMHRVRNLFTTVWGRVGDFAPGIKICPFFSRHFKIDLFTCSLRSVTVAAHGKTIKGIRRKCFKSNSWPKLP